MLGARKKQRSRTRFTDLSLPQRAGIAILGAVEVGLLIAAEVDIQRRPADQVAGKKLWWRGLCLINVIGPLSYFRWGRRRPSAATSSVALRDAVASPSAPEEGA